MAARFILAHDGVKSQQTKWYAIAENSLPGQVIMQTVDLQVKKRSASKAQVFFAENPMYFDDNLEIKKCAVILRIIRTICVHLLIPPCSPHTAMTDYCWKAAGEKMISTFLRR